MKMKRGCVNCHHFKAGTGTCNAPIPASVHGFLIRRRPVTWEDGKNCGAHRMMAVRKSKPSETPIRELIAEVQP